MPKVYSKCPKKLSLEKQVFLNKKPQLPPMLDFGTKLTWKTVKYSTKTPYLNFTSWANLSTENISLSKFFFVFCFRRWWEKDFESLVKTFWQGCQSCFLPFYVSRWTFSDKILLFWVNCFCLSIFDFQG